MPFPSSGPENCPLRVPHSLPGVLLQRGLRHHHGHGHQAGAQRLLLGTSGRAGGSCHAERFPSGQLPHPRQPAEGRLLHPVLPLQERPGQRAHRVQEAKVCAGWKRTLLPFTLRPFGTLHQLAQEEFKRPVQKMGANAAGNMQETCLGAERRGQSHFKTADQHSGQRLPAGVPFQIMTFLCVAQLCLLTLSALPHTNCSSGAWEPRSREIIQEHFRTTWESSVNVTLREASPRLRKNNTPSAAALLQTRRDSRMKILTILRPIGTVASLMYASPLGALFSSCSNLVQIRDWWRVRLKPGGAFVAHVVIL